MSEVGLRQEWRVLEEREKRTVLAEVSRPFGWTGTARGERVGRYGKEGSWSGPSGPYISSQAKGTPRVERPPSRRWTDQVTCPGVRRTGPRDVS